MKKILISADCNGHFDTLVKKVTPLHAKNHFDFMLCIGSVLEISQSECFRQLTEGKLVLPLSTYFIESGPMAATLNTLYPNGKEMAKNLTFLGRVGQKTIQGVSIAYLNGVENRQTGQFYSRDCLDYSGQYFTLQDVQKLCKLQTKVDILLTNQWPEDKDRELNRPSRYVSRIVYCVSPRYHFAASEGVYFKRKEYRSRNGHPTSFISVGPITKDSQNKEKYLHGLQTVPMSELDMSQMEIQDIEDNPYEAAYALDSAFRIPSKKQVSSQKPQNADFTVPPIIYFQRFSERTYESEIQQFIERWGPTKRLQIFFDESKRKHKGCGIVVFQDVEVAKNCLAESGKYSLHGSKIKFSVKTTDNQYTDDACWFCRESKVFDESLVFYMGKHCYMALDKGPITPEHFLIIPLGHVTNLPALTPFCQQEMFMLQGRIRRHFLTNSKMDQISFERFLNLTHSVNHYIRQVVLVDAAKLSEMASQFQKLCRQQKLDFLKISEADFQSHTKNNFYYRMTFGDVSYVCLVKQRGFPIDFGRKVTCELLDLTERYNWKSCVNESKSRQQLTNFRRVVKQCHLQADNDTQ